MENPSPWTIVCRDVSFLYLLDLLAEEWNGECVECLTWEEIRHAIAALSPLQRAFLANRLADLAPFQDGEIDLRDVTIVLRRIESRDELHLSLRPSGDEPAQRQRAAYLSSLTLEFRELLNGVRVGTVEEFVIIHPM